MSFFIEYVNKTFADNLTLFFRFFHTCQFAEEFLAGIYSDYIQSETFIIMKYIFEFVLTQHAVIYKNAGKILAYRFI